MHPEVFAIAKQYPWLAQIHPFVAQAEIARIEEFDANSLELVIGDYEGWSKTYGYFVDKNGVILGKVHPQIIEDGAINAIHRTILWAFGTLRYELERTIYDAAYKLSNIDHIRYIVLVSEIKHNHGLISLIFMRLPDEKRFTELMNEYDEAFEKECLEALE